MPRVISTDKAPAAIGTYSQAVVYGDLLYISGQIGLDPETGEFVADDFRQQAQRVFKNILAIIEAAGAKVTNIIKFNVSIKDMDKFPIFNEVMQEFISEPYPARAVVAVKELPKSAHVEVETIVGMNDAL